MYEQSKFSDSGYRNSVLSGKGWFSLPRLTVWSAAIIYFLCVLFLVLLTKFSLASSIEISQASQGAAETSSNFSGKIISAVVGLGLAFAFLKASIREAHKLLP